MDIYDLLPNPDAPVSQTDFTARQRIAQIDRIHILANRAERTEAAQKTHRESLQPPRTSRSNSVVEADRLEKQALLKRLASRVVEITTDPQDQTMFDFIDRVEGEAARTAFQKVLAQGEDRGLGALTADEKELVLRWKNKSELQSQRRADEASRQLGLYASLYASDSPSPSETACAFSIRTIP